MIDASYRLVPISEPRAQRLLEWRQHPAVRVGLRTEELISPHAQREWWERISRPGSRDRYWALEHRAAPGAHWSSMVAAVGLVAIHWPNGTAEISLVVDPAAWGRGHGRAAVGLALREAFAHMGLRAVYGEAYALPDGPVQFWRAMVAEFGGRQRREWAVRVPLRKRWDGQSWDGLLFWWRADEWPYGQSFAWERVAQPAAEGVAPVEASAPP